MPEPSEIAASRSVQRDYRKPIWRRFLSAVRAYHLIEPGDRVAVCLSGGKDSLALAVCMRELARYSNIPFSVEYLMLDPGYAPENRQKALQNAESLGFAPHVADAPIFEALDGLDRSFCHVCAAMRRGYLYKEAQKLGCNKIALGHHMDDVVETILLSMLYGGEYKTMMPVVQSRNYRGMRLIRPMYLIRERDIDAWRRSLGIDTLRCACRVTASEDGGKRRRVKTLLAQLERETPSVIGNIFHSSEHVCLQTVLGYQPRVGGEIVPVTVQEEEHEDSF